MSMLAQWRLVPDGRVLASGDEDDKIKLWDVASGKMLRIFAGHKDPVSCVAFSPDGGCLRQEASMGLEALDDHFR